ncbi:MAG: CDP-2,3-bis-(O-geranylgeranyl)-sn-glycerol synthase [Candidatus Diapherotrites archaeon]|nr:CDP-2,3-bis-(O-geranylgeranyl)-sn-glycerol synthase [Candidatus Diapherotrites archaeon]
MDFIRIVLFVLPLYVANSSAMLLGGKTPLDLGARFLDGREILGAGKTFKGTFLGIAMGTLTAVVLEYLFPQWALNVSPHYIWLGFWLSVGAVAGDMAGSFIKRRMGSPPGAPAIFLDQLDFLAGGILLGSLYFVPSIPEIVVITVFTLVIHRLSNGIAFRLKLKKVPW